MDTELMAKAKEVALKARALNDDAGAAMIIYNALQQVAAHRAPADDCECGHDKRMHVSHSRKCLIHTCDCKLFRAMPTQPDAGGEGQGIQVDEIKFKAIAKEIEYKWECGGLTDGFYDRFAFECASEYVARYATPAPAPDESVVKAATEERDEWETSYLHLEEVHYDLVEAVKEAVRWLPIDTGSDKADEAIVNLRKVLAASVAQVGKGREG